MKTSLPFNIFPPASLIKEHYKNGAHGMDAGFEHAALLIHKNTKYSFFAPVSIGF
jgi:hypothetical protein